MKNNDLLTKIESSTSLAELNSAFHLPEPYDDAGYYMIYYCEADYRQALPEILEYIDSGMRVYYDRYLESGEAHIRDFCRRAVGSHCRCIVFYLSENVFGDPTFLALLRLVGERSLPCISVNIAAGGAVRSGEAMRKGRELPEDIRDHVCRIFSNEVTFIPFGLPVEEKKRELRRAYEEQTMHFSIQGDFAVAEYVKDLSEDEVVIPRSIEINGVDYPVRAVSARAFSGCRELVRVVFPETVEDIGYGCDDPSRGEVFENCESLVEINYPPNVKWLYGGMFNGCKSLRRLVLSDNIEFVGTGETHFDFSSQRGNDLRGTGSMDDGDDEEIVINPHELEYIHLPQSAKLFYMGDGTVRFAYDSSDKCFTAYLKAEIVTGGDVISLRETQEITRVSELYQLAANGTVREVTFPRDFVFGEKWIRVFNGCPNLRRVVLPQTVIALDHTFYQCNLLSSVELPDSLAEIGVGSFYECKSLRTVRLPRRVCCVADSAFLGCHLTNLICDSDYAYNIFKSGYRRPPFVWSQRTRGMRVFVGILMRLFGTTRDQLHTKGIQWWTEIDNIYIKDSVKEFKVEGYEKVKSDLDGYRKYVCRISFGERLRFKGKQFDLRNR